jgi:hypothetical protein
MKIKVIFLAILVCVVLFGSCVGTNALGVFDESVPEDMRCDLEIRNNLAVILFNNMPVEWVPGLSENKVTITLPPGNHTFGVRYFITRSYGNYQETVPVLKTVEAEFIPGHSYQIYKQEIWILVLTITNIKVKDVTPKDKA